MNNNMILFERTNIRRNQWNETTIFGKDDWSSLNKKCTHHSRNTIDDSQSFKKQCKEKWCTLDRKIYMLIRMIHPIDLLSEVDLLQQTNWIHIWNFCYDI